MRYCASTVLSWRCPNNRACQNVTRFPITLCYVLYHRNKNCASIWSSQTTSSARCLLIFDGSKILWMNEWMNEWINHLEWMNHRRIINQSINHQQWMNINQSIKIISSLSFIHQINNQLEAPLHRKQQQVCAVFHCWNWKYKIKEQHCI